MWSTMIKSIFNEQTARPPKNWPMMVKRKQGGKGGKTPTRSVATPDIVMIIGTIFIEGEVVAGARLGMAGIEVIAIEAGVVAIVQIMIEPMAGLVMMMSVGGEVGPLKGEEVPASTEKHRSSAKVREMSGNNIFADGKAESRDHLGGVRKPPGNISLV
ncbi:hypothetical protein M8C21_020711 [Ambrosia artemisiifolia]|uniref:DUF4057 domain-containing protein n=1 Tax=Ambrosia artemisiifolia TaxID=4212 RepID=A0AAD5GIR7_AMBAR|nr:hypothetical protein M8C21_020711 [Ambrosia artemisiifolia]